MWKTAKEMVKAIKNNYHIDILPIQEEQMLTYSELRKYVKRGHKDPSDHVIISHAITNRMILVSSDQNFPYYVDYGLDLLFNEK